MQFHAGESRLFATISSAVATILIGFSLLLVIVPSTNAADSTCQYFPETNHSACGKFLDYWKANGGLAQQGYPISDEFSETNAPPPAGDGKNHQVQYFQRARFEHHLENQAPYDILLGLLGSEQFQAKYPKGVPVDQQVQHPIGTCQHFDATNLDVCGVFLTYWEQHGGLAQQGYPVSDTFVETNASPPAGDGQQHVVQYFQRARFELHGNDQSVSDVELGLLGSEQFGTKYPNGGTPTTADANPTTTNGATTTATTPVPATTTTSTPTPTITATPTPSATTKGGSYAAAGCLPAVNTTGDVVQACVDNSAPSDGSTVTVYGRLVIGGQAISGVTMDATWNYKTTTSSCNAATDMNGVAACSRDIGRATKGYTVAVDVSFSYAGQTYTAQTSFTPQ